MNSTVKRNKISQKLLGIVALVIAGLIVIVVANSDKSFYAKLSSDLKKECEENSFQANVTLLHNNNLIGIYSIDELIQTYRNDDTSIPYGDSKVLRMYPLTDFLTVRENINMIQLVTCQEDQKILLTAEELQTLPEPIYWVTKRKTFIKAHSIIYDEIEDVSTKTGSFRAKPILMINLISEN